MARILFAWELGGGSGHLAPMRPVFERLIAQGHEVTAAVQMIARAAVVYSGMKIRIMQAPLTEPEGWGIVRSYADLLSQAGMSNGDSLFALLHAWDEVFDLVKPDLILSDFAPLSLLASRTHRARRATVGSGFFCPPDVSPLPFFPTEGADNDPTGSIQLEGKLLETTNRVLERRGGGKLERMSEIYTGLDAKIFRSYPELDHFEARADGFYAGMWATGYGVDPVWPRASASLPAWAGRIVAYLVPSRESEAYLDVLAMSGMPTLVFGQGWEPLAARYAGSSLSIVTRPVNADKAIAQAALVISNGNHGIVCTALRFGKPMLFIPSTYEQFLLVKRIEALGAGSTLPRDHMMHGEEPLRMALQSGMREQAMAFSRSHAWDPLERVTGKILELLGALRESR